LIFFLIFLIPLAIYFLILSLLNRRGHPVMLSGVWDAIALLFGASGLVIAVGPGVLSSVSERWRYFWLLGKNPNSGIFADEGRELWMMLCVFYFVSVAGAATYFVLRRRHSTAIYNMSLGAFEDVFGDVLNGLGLCWTRAGNRVFVSYPNNGDREASAAAVGDTGTSTAVAVATETMVPSATITVEPFPTLRHITLKWQNDDEGLRHEIEGELAKLLPRIPSRANPAATWFLGLAGVLFVAMFTGLIALLVLRLIERR
jgi:hypothetical protein